MRECDFALSHVSCDDLSRAFVGLAHRGGAELAAQAIGSGWVDEYHLFLTLVVIEGTPPCSFELVSAKAMPSGIILSPNKVAGPLKT